MVLFAIFLAWSTFKTYKSGSEDTTMSSKEPLLGFVEVDDKLKFPKMKLGILVVVWFSFSSLFLLRGNREGEVCELYPAPHMDIGTFPYKFLCSMFLLLGIIIVIDQTNPFIARILSIQPLHLLSFKTELKKKL
ncbi:hypothetical protein Tsubulata_036398 [Turnera subulata]|uniref:Uncharacterized protein n=1 Tax=Turnera subulata TaxID=218843 RepID=A0A9Q0JIL1_9ROSI|nr:hypothetical protein Tsubulata_036398 [Turnera subulata]